MGLLNRYLLGLKRPAADTFSGVKENLREIERSFNILPVPAPQLFTLAGSSVPFTLTKKETFTFAVARKSTVVEITLYVTATCTTAGGQFANFWGGIDNARIDAANACSQDDFVGTGGVGGATVSTTYVTTLTNAGKHTIELWAKKNINAGVFAYTGYMLLKVY